LDIYLRPLPDGAILKYIRPMGMEAAMAEAMVRDPIRPDPSIAALSYRDFWPVSKRGSLVSTETDERKPGIRDIASARTLNRDQFTILRAGGFGSPSNSKPLLHCVQ
jgi:hypothetical protein